MDFTLSANGQLVTMHLQTIWLVLVVVVLIVLATFKKR